MSIVVVGKTIEKAIAEGLKQLNAELEDVEVKVISEGGLLKKAKIEMCLTSELEIKNEKEKEEVKKVKQEKVESLKEVEIDLETEQKNKNNKKELATKTADLAKEWLDGLIYAYNVNATAIVETKENFDIYANIDGENLGVLIGYHGEAMEAIGYLLNTYLFNKIKGASKVFLDVSGYRSKRVEELKETALKLAKKVKENKRKYKLDPMNSYERRVIHEALSNMENITTHSEGTEPNRYLVIEYNENK